MIVSDLPLYIKYNSTILSPWSPFYTTASFQLSTVLFRFRGNERQLIARQAANRKTKMSQLMRLRYLSHRRTAKAQASLHIRAVSPEPLLFAHMKYESRLKVRPKIRHLAPLDGSACMFEE